MGNHNSVVLGAPCDDLKFKTGVKSEPVPSPGGAKASTFEKIINSPEFKNYLLGHLDSSYFVSSLIQKSDEDAVLLQGIQQFQSLDPEHRAETTASIKQFQKMSSAGVCASVTENVALCEKELEIRSEVQASPFTKFLQYRLAAIRNLSALVAKERGLQTDRLHPLPMVESTLNTRTTSELHYLLPMQSAGFSLLELLAVFFPATTDPGHKSLLAAQLEQFCNELGAIPSLSLFSTWSPAAMVPLKTAALSIESATSSAGEAMRALDGSGHTCWTVSGRRGDWAVDLVEPTAVEQIRIAWSQSKTASPSSPSGAPLQLKILCKKEGKQFYELVQTVDMDAARLKHPTWVHSYPVDAGRVTAIKLILSGTKSSKSPIKMFSFEALCEDTEAMAVHPLRSLKKIQDKLFPLAQHAEIQHTVFSSLPVVTRISGSLEAALDFIRFIKCRNLDEKMRLHAAREMYALAKAVYAEEEAVKDVATGEDANCEVVLSDVVFDEMQKSSGIEITEGGMMSGAITGGNSYSLLTCVMDSGVWEWEVTLVKENHGDETSCLGVARRPVTNASYEASEDMWLIRCYNGETYHGGRTGRKSLPTIHPSDICRFSYDTATQCVSLTINEVEQGVVFENVPPGISPCVAFYGSGKTVRVLTVKRRGGATKNGIISDSSLSKTDLDVADSSSYYGSESDIPSMQEMFGLPKEDIVESKEESEKEEKGSEEVCHPIVALSSTVLLKRVSRLARLRAVIFQRAIDSEMPHASQSLEYPFAVQVNANVFEQLIELLSISEDVNGEDNKSVMLSCLHIIEAQFSCLTYSKVDPQCVGLGAVRGKSCNKLMYTLASRLRQLISSPDNEVKKAAAETFSRGIPYIFPHIAGRVEFALSILRELKGPSAVASMDISKMVLLKAIIRRLSRYSETLQVLNLFKKDSTWRDHINQLIFALVDMIADYSTFSVLNCPSSAVNGQVLTDDIEFRTNIMSMLKKFQEQLVFELASAGIQDMKSNYTYRCTVQIMLRYCNKLLSSGVNVLERLILASNGSRDVGELPKTDALFTELISPVMHSFCLCAHHVDFVCGVLPVTTRMMRCLSDIVSASSKCQSAQRLLCQAVACRGGGSLFTDNIAEGWKTINAVFEETDSSYAISDGGVVYTSVQSSNTCALVNTGFSSPQRAAWEFLLENDTNNDECAVFGASTLPIVSRCYSSSSNLWMRRCYNGYLYAQGRSTGQTLEKIHPNDQVRVEFDGKAGTISYSVNGGPLELAFTGITGEIHPCVGSYRTGVKVRLLKVEVYGSGGDISSGMKEADRPAAVVHWDIDDALVQPGTKSDILCPAKSLATDALPPGVNAKEKTELAAKIETWVTGRGDRGAAFGVHEWSFEILDRSKTPITVGVVFGGKPYARDRLGGPCFIEGPLERLMVNTKKGSRYYCGRKNVTYYSGGENGWHPGTDGACSCDGTCGPTNGCQCEDCYRASFPSEFEVASATSPPQHLATPPPSTDIGPTAVSLIRSILEGSSDAPDIVEDVDLSASGEDDMLIASDYLPSCSPTLERGSRSGGSADRGSGGSQSPPALTTTPSNVASGVRSSAVESGQTRNAYAKKVAFSYADSRVTAMAWASDGSLWINGEKRRDGFGKAEFPTDKYSVISVRVDRFARTISYYVNGVFVGVAFGPTGSGAAVEVPLPPASGDSKDEDGMIYPAASVSSFQQSIKIRASGFYGSVVLPTILHLQKSCASVIGRLSSSLVVGPPLTPQEDVLGPWLKSPLFVGGLDSSISMVESDNVDSHIYDWSRSWADCELQLTQFDASSSFGISNRNIVPKLARFQVSRGIVSVKMDWLDGVLISTEELKHDAGRVVVEILLCTSGRKLDAASSFLKHRGADIEWSSCSEMLLNMNVSVLTGPLVLDVKLSVETTSAKTELCSAMIDISCELAADKAAGVYFVPVQPKGVITVSVDYRADGDDALLASNFISTAVHSEGESLLEGTVSSICTGVLEDITDVASQKGVDFIAWLERISPEPAWLRQRLEKNGSYSFPLVERPLVACLLKHGSLVQEAEQIMSAIQSEHERSLREDTASTVNISTLDLPSPSSDMTSLWKRVQQFRSMLRTKRQKFKETEVNKVQTGEFELFENEINDIAPVVTSAVHELPPPMMCGSGEHEMVLSDTLDGAYAYGWSCNLCGASGTDERWWCSACEDDYCLSCRPRPQASDVIVVDAAGTEPVELSSPAEFFASQRDTLWKSQPEGTRSVCTSRPLSYYCVVKSVGVDLEHEVGYLSFQAHGDGSLGPLQNANASQLLIGNTLLKPSIHQYDAATSDDISGHLRFDLFSVNLQESSSWKFTFGSSGYDAVEVIPPDLNTVEGYMPEGYGVFSNNDSLLDLEKKKLDVPKSFNDLCSVFRSKILFLLQLTPAGSGDSNSSENSKSILLNLMDKYADSSYGNTKLVRWRSDEGQSRWKNMVEFLRVHTKLRRQVSSERVAAGDSTASHGDAIAAITGVNVEAASTVEDADDHHSEDMDSTVSDGDLEIDDMTPAEAAMQACTVFINFGAQADNKESDTSGSASTQEELPSASAVEGLYAAMRMRAQRAQIRIFGINAINEVLRMDNVTVDPFAVEEVILFLRTAFDSELLGSSDSEKRTRDKSKSPRRIHYLVNLEGCNALTLANVQGSFLEMYSSLLVLLQEYLYKWKTCSQSSDALLTNSLFPGAPDLSRGPSLTRGDALETFLKREKLAQIYLGPIKMMMAAWSLHFSGRDHRFLLKCNIITCLQRIFSLSEYERAVVDWTKAARALTSFVEKYEVCCIDQSVTENFVLWPSQYVQQGLKSGSVSCRAILLCVCRLPLSVLPEIELEKLNLQRSKFLENCKSLSTSDVSMLYEQVCAIVLRNIEKKQAELEAEKEKDVAIRGKYDKELRSQLKEGRVPYFDKKTKNDDITLSGGDTVATSEIAKVLRDFTVRAVYADVEYNFVRGMEKTGNYFEMTLLDIGDRDIGIGLAVKGKFPTKGEMPGWVDHSYGLHGDDGRRFGGSGSVSESIWPIWNDNDVIGCGVNFESRSIFYTLNGVLLGDGFTDIGDDALFPVVGFHCATKPQSVRVNFGLYPFHYAGPEIKGHPKALSMRKWFSEWRAEHMLSKACPTILLAEDGALPSPELSRVSSAGSEPSLVDNIAFRQEEKAEQELQESKVDAEDDSSSGGALVPTTAEEYHAKLSELETVVEISSERIVQFCSLRRYSDALLRFLLVTSNTLSVSSGTADTPASPTKVQSLDPASQSVTDLDQLPDIGDSPAPALIKGRSTFGTPKYVTAEDGALLQECILAVVIQDVLVGAIYMSYAVGENVDGGHLSGSLNHPPPATISIKDVMYHLDDFVRDTGSGRMTPSVSAVSTEEGNKDCMGLSNGAVEIGEIERTLYEHLTTLLGLCAVMKSLQQELSRSVCLKALLILLRIGTPRLRNATYRLLLLCLPSVSPEVVDATVHRVLWKDSSEESADECLDQDSTLFAKQKRMSTARSIPDVFIKGLLCAIRQAVSSNSGSFPMKVSSTVKTATEVLSSENISTMSSTSGPVAESEVESSHTLDENISESILPLEGEKEVKKKRKSSIKKVSFESGENELDFKIARPKDPEMLRIIPFGYGEVSIDRADEYIDLIQRLFETPSWTDVVACSLTEGLREAVTVLKKYNARQGELTTTCSGTGADSVSYFVATIEQACAVCAVLCGLGSLYPGARIELADGTAGKIISVNNLEGSADILTGDYLTAIGNCGFSSGSVQYIETVPIQSLRAQCDGVKVVLGDLSQPLVQLLTAVVKQCLQWFQKNVRDGTNHAKSNEDAYVTSLLTRLNSLSSNAFSVVLEKQHCSVTDLAQDQSLINDIVGVSLLPGGLEIFPSLSEVSRMWLFAQSRSIEYRGVNSGGVEPPEPSTAVASEAEDVPDDDTLPQVTMTAFHPHPLFLDFSDNGWACDGRTVCPDGCKSNCTGFRQSSGWIRYRCSSCDFDLCGKCVSEYMPKEVPDCGEPEKSADEERDSEIFLAARIAEKPAVASDDACVFSATDGPGATIGMAERIVLAIKLQETYKLNNFAFCLSVLEYFNCDETKTAAFFAANVAEIKLCDEEWGCPKTTFKYKNRVSIEPENALKQVDPKLATGSGSSSSAATRILGSGDKAPTADVSGPLLTLSACELMKSTKSSKSKVGKTDSGKDSVYLHVGDIVCASDLEGPAALTGLHIGRCITAPAAASGTAIVTYYDREMGAVFCEGHQVTMVRKLSAFFEKSPDTIPAFCSQLDVALTILRMRNITGRLLAEGNISLHSKADCVKDWLGLLKLSCTNEIVGDSAESAPSSGLIGGRKMTNSLAPLCNALLASARAYPALESVGTDGTESGSSMESNVIDILTGDVLTNIDMLMDTSNIADPTVGADDNCTTDEQTKSSALGSSNIYSSTHPFVSNHEVAGSISCPEFWKGAVITFDEKCAISETAATLNFYKNSKDLSSKKSSVSFSGDGAKVQNFSSVIVGEKEPIIFRFGTQKIAPKNKVVLKSIYGSAKGGSDGEYMGFNDLYSLSSTAEFQRRAAVANSSTAVSYQMLQRKRYTLSADELTSQLLVGSLEESPAKRIHIKLLFPESSTLSITDSTRLRDGVWFYEVRVDSRSNKYRKSGHAVGPEGVGPESLFPESGGVPSSGKVPNLITDVNECSMIGLIDIPEDLLTSRCRNMTPGADHVSACCFLNSSSVLIMARGIPGSEFLDYVEESIDDLGIWEPGDTIGCLHEKDGDNFRLRFSRNGVWSNRYICLPSWFSDGLYPAIFIRNSVAFQPNFGGNGNKFLCPPQCYCSRTPTGDVSDAPLPENPPLFTSTDSTAILHRFLTVAGGGDDTIDVTDIVQTAEDVEPAADEKDSTDLGNTIEEKRIDYFGVVSPKSLATPEDNVVMKVGSGYSICSASPIPTEVSTTCLTNWTPSPLGSRDLLSWGYRFKVQELKSLQIRVVRDFELVWKSDVKDFKSPSHVYIWKPTNIPPDYISCSQIATSSPKPPVGGLLIHRSQCKPPLSFRQVFTSHPLKFTMWRASPPSGYVALGDVVMTFSSGSSSSTPSTESFACVPLWAVLPCHMGSRLLKCEKGGEKNKPHKCSFWSVRSEMGAFMGSAKEHAEKIGSTYKLNANVYNIVRGEWLNESDALSLPSFSWTCGLIDFLLSNPRSRERTLTGPIFQRLATYLQCSASVYRLRIVPLLIKMIRLGKQLNVVLPYELLDGCCRSILKEATTRATKDKFLGEGLLCLVDLVVEVASVHLSSKEGSEPSHNTLVPGNEQMDVVGTSPYMPGGEIVESKEEIGDGIESKEDDSFIELPVLGQLPPMERQATVESQFTRKCSSITYEEWISKGYFREADVFNPIKDVGLTWWSMVLPEEEKNKHRLTVQATDMDKLLLRKVSVLYRLRQIIGFLRALGAGPVSTDALSRRSLPFGLLMKAWYEHVSTSVIEETAHPYTALHKSYKKRVFFPGATTLNVVFDSRCSLNSAVLKLTYQDIKKSSGGKPLPLKETILKGGITGNWPQNPIVVYSNYVDIEFMPSSKPTTEAEAEALDSVVETDENREGHWGWACVVHASSGSIYNVAETQIEIPPSELGGSRISTPVSGKEGLGSTDVNGLPRDTPRLFKCSSPDSFDISVSHRDFSIQQGDVVHKGAVLSYDHSNRRVLAIAHTWTYDIRFSDDFTSIESGDVSVLPDCPLCCKSVKLCDTADSSPWSCSGPSHSASEAPASAGFNEIRCRCETTGCDYVLCPPCCADTTSRIVSKFGGGDGGLLYREAVDSPHPTLLETGSDTYSPLAVQTGKDNHLEIKLNELEAHADVSPAQQSAIKKILENPKAAMEKLSKRDLKKVDSDKSSERTLDRNELILVTLFGKKLSAGSIGIPNASVVELNIERPNPRPSSATILYVLHLQYYKNDELKEEYVLVSEGKVSKSFNTASVEYTLYTLPEHSIPKFENRISSEQAEIAADVVVSSVSTSEKLLAESPVDVEMSSPVDPAPVSGEADTAVGQVPDEVFLSITDPVTDSNVPSVVEVPDFAFPVAETPESIAPHVVVEPSLDIGSSGGSAAEIPAEAAEVGLAMADPGTWACPICTFLNELTSDACLMCAMPRAEGGGGVVDEGEERVTGDRADSPVVPAGVAAWWCSRCTFMNPLTNTSCEMCGGPSGGPSSGAEVMEEPHEEEDEERSGEDESAGGEDNDEEEDEDTNDDDDEDEDDEEEEEDEPGFSLFDDADGSSGETTAAPVETNGPELVSKQESADSAAIDAVVPVADKIVDFVPDIIVLTVSATKISSAANCETRLEQSIISGAWTPMEFMERMFYNWDAGADAILIDFLDSQKNSKKITDNVDTVVLPRSFMDYKSQGFSRFNLLEVQSRILTISYFNQHLEELLPIINLRNPDSSSLGAMIRQRSRYVFSHVKQPMLDAELEATATSSGSGIPASFNLDNMKATLSQDKGEIDPTTSQCCFVQAFKELRGKDSNIYRHIFSGDRVFQIQFVGESGIDAGGVFREGVMRMVDDLFSEHFNLLLLCPNGIHSVHINMEKYVPNPKHTSALALQMFEFLGKLMGMSLRVKLCLPFELPSLVWKQLVGEELVFDDLMAIDSLTCKYLDAVKNCANDGITDQESFSAKYQDRLKFVYTGSDGVERELVKGGRDILVSYETRLEYTRLVVNARLAECTKQVAAIARGMAEVVPMRVLQLYSWQQLETLVVGSATFDIDLWKKHTDASGISSRCLALFWKVMESLTTKEQAGFVRFAWGRSRLPAAKDFKTKMKLTPAGRAPLPIAHTCFFSIELPDYPTEEKMRHGLLTAIHFGAGGILMG